MLREHGFWEYTTPSSGGCERYGLDDYRRLLDDMAGAGMNSLLLVVKWFSTGYRSKLPFLDQAEDNPVIASDNDLLRQVIREAHSRGILLRLGAVVTAYPVDLVAVEPRHSYDALCGIPLPCRIGFYDTDQPGIEEQALRICLEIAENFPEADGLMVELENAEADRPHRIPFYNQWAAANGRPSYGDIGRPVSLRYLDDPHWRAYTTSRRIDLLRQVESSLRVRGFQGSLCTICETGRTDYTAAHEVDLKMLHEDCPAWEAITYEYEKFTHRYAMMDFCIETPKKAGLTVFYLPRGIMTWDRGNWKHPITLPESWRMDVEDILRFQPDGVWWFGAGTKSRGAHADCTLLPAEGFADEYDARRALLEIAAPLRME